jgi:hypothetical protein
MYCRLNMSPTQTQLLDYQILAVLGQMYVREPTAALEMHRTPL